MAVYQFDGDESADNRCESYCGVHHRHIDTSMVGERSDDWQPVGWHWPDADGHVKKPHVLCAGKGGLEPSQSVFRAPVQGLLGYRTGVGRRCY